MKYYFSNLAKNFSSSSLASGVVPLSCSTMSTSSAVLLSISLLVRLILATLSVSGAHPPSSREANPPGTFELFLVS